MEQGSLFTMSSVTHTRSWNKTDAQSYKPSSYLSFPLTQALTLVALYPTT
ncbi:hypothetical protein ID866_10997 [Astraeus odoratus]|nr:hypothetical protein ID866_10997 [Astraeus odoratus]